MQLGTKILLGVGATFLLGLTLALVLFAIPDPDEGYESSLRYAIRNDIQVLEIPKLPPLQRHAPGQMDAWLLDLRSQGAVTCDPRDLKDAERTRLATALESLFGTPAAPKLGTSEQARSLGIDESMLHKGAVLYKDKCIQCHGMLGDGRGPTSLMVYPPARDFRRGKFKFVSVLGNGIPSQEDLQKIIRTGIRGNSMPPFDLLTPEQLADLAAYTTHLAMRGQVEFLAIRELLSEEGLSGDLKDYCEQTYSRLLKSWVDAAAMPIQPREIPAIEPHDAGSDPVYDERIRRGHELFSSKEGCANCHVDYGRKDHFLHDIWGFAIRPNNLTLGEPKAGKQPLDLFLRIRGGIAPTGMPASSLHDEQVWDLVAFVMALPVPRHLPEDIRKKVYPLSQ